MGDLSSDGVMNAIKANQADAVKRQEAQSFGGALKDLVRLATTGLKTDITHSSGSMSNGDLPSCAAYEAGKAKADKGTCRNR
jgi:hypothetical protein